ncbi:MAG: FAD-dependent thymidylate synthase [Terriglobales bacterium]
MPQRNRTLYDSFRMSEADRPQARSSPPKQRRPATEVYAIYGVEPEVQAYAMAKYSRSALSMKESLKEISEQKAEKFLNTFYFQYGHRSIADLAHAAFAIERLSLLAAIVLVDEQRWDGQERSTRYQDFSHPDYFIPDFAHHNDSLLRLYTETIDFLFSEYRDLSEAVFRQLASRVPKPPEMKADYYERTLRARAFDVARYLLPLATNTSLGQIVNARTLENQISRLLSHTHPEVRELGERLKQAAREPAYNLKAEKAVRVAPTLVKYADPSPYIVETRRELQQAAAELMGDAAIAPAPAVDLLDYEPVEIELPTTLLYEHCHYPYRQIRERVAALPQSRREEITSLGTRHRGQHDELLRAFCAGQKFRFDILMDIGGFRDLHRHRRCIQIGQGFTSAHGYDIPEDVAAAGWRERYASAMQRAADAAAELARDELESSQYLIPLACRKRTLFKMDFAEVVYITELRTGPAGHFSYRHIAWQMYEAVARRHPALARYFRVQDPREPVDLLQR